MHFEVTERLLDVYLAALAEFYDAHHPPVWHWLRRDSNRARQQTSKCRLAEARCNYWIQVEIFEAVSTEITGRRELLPA